MSTARNILSSAEGEGALRDALKQLECSDSCKACIARMRLVGRLSLDEIAFFLGVDATTVEKEWRFIRAWLIEELGSRRP